MVSKRLESLDLRGTKHDEVAPMFYNDWITSVVNQHLDKVKLI